MKADPCAGLDQCHFWPRHDDRCDRVTGSHSTMCALHEDYDYTCWWETHAVGDCCQICCKGEIEHE